ncbi:hypothetical protein BH23VER1_BH23VER1_01460 [soil metagenome]
MQNSLAASLTASLTAFLWGGLLLSVPSLPASEPTALFDEESLAGWSTKHPAMWRVEDGAITAGNGSQKIPHNSFLTTEKSFGDFEFRCRFKLTGDPATGMINSGIQFRSEPLPDGNVRGYQADIGDPAWWGSIYDEHRRNKILAQSDMAKLDPVLDRDGWNTYVIRCEGPRSRLYINDVLTVDYLEEQPDIPAHGVFSLQLHGGGAAKIQFKEITVTELGSPEQPGQPESPEQPGQPGQPGQPESPLTPAEQQSTFSVPEGFTVELVASEETGLPKPITVTFDDAGRMWSMTATEYPLDANENQDQAMALWAKGGQDRVVVFDDPTAPGPHTARTFADGLAMPMGILPYKDGAIVGQGPDILFFQDTDANGTADRKEVLLTGFGVQDSHLMPHQFTRVPGGWVLVAQGAFNRSDVVASGRPPVEFDYCKLGRFQLDGSEFETVGWGPNNIWGLVHSRSGELFTQEANDQGHAVIPFQFYTSVEGIGNDKFRDYAPFVPKLNAFRLGGTGLSGLALCEDRSGSFPDPWHGAMFVANPITRTINTVQLTRTPDGYSIDHLPDLLSSSDDWFRPVAITFGPDGCLYVVDWYNKIISHNEVAREHPDRDKSRGRIWRIHHHSQQHRPIPDLTSIPTPDLPAHLRSDSTWQMRAAWHQLADRDIPPAERDRLVGPLALDPSAPPESRVHALWLAPAQAGQLLDNPDADLRRGAATVFTGNPESLAVLAEDPDHLVRTAAIRNLAARQPLDAPTVGALIPFCRPPLTGGTDLQVYNREFERSLVRAAFEASPDPVAAFLASPAADDLPAENRLFATLALPESAAAAPFVHAWKVIDRHPGAEELLLLVGASRDPALRPTVASILERDLPASLEALVTVADRAHPDLVAPLLAPAIRPLVAAGSEQAIRAAATFKMTSLEPELLALLDAPDAPSPSLLAALDSLAAIASRSDAIATLAADSSAPHDVRAAAIRALAASASQSAPQMIASLWPDLHASAQKPLTESLSQSKTGARALVLAGLSAQDLAPDQLARMHALLPDDPQMDALWNSASHQFQQVLRLAGGNDDFADAHIDLGEAFTVECWVRLDPGISNADGVLGRPGDGGADLNFYAATPRFFSSAASRDLVVASRPIQPDTWVHLALTHAPGQPFHLFLNGELDASSDPVDTATFTDLAIGRTSPNAEGTAGAITEFRVWDFARDASSIRADFDRTYFGDPALPDGLVRYFPGPGEWPPLRGDSHVATIADGPALLSHDQSLAQQQKLARMATVASRQGDPSAGQILFEAACLSCHVVGDKGAHAAPALDGSAHRDLDGLLRSILAPDAAVEAGYRVFQVGTNDGQLVEGFLVKDDPNGITLRFMGGTDLRFAADNIVSAKFLNRSFMPAGIIDSWDESQVADLFTYIRTLK